jgi:hypothetical protein
MTRTSASSQASMSSLPSNMSNSGSPTTTHHQGSASRANSCASFESAYDPLSPRAQWEAKARLYNKGLLRYLARRIAAAEGEMDPFMN